MWGKLQRWIKFSKHGQAKTRLQTPTHLFQPVPVANPCQPKTGAQELASVAEEADAARGGFYIVTIALLHLFCLDDKI